MRGGYNSRAAKSFQQHYKIQFKFAGERFRPRLAGQIGYKGKTCRGVDQLLVAVGRALQGKPHPGRGGPAQVQGQGESEAEGVAGAGSAI